MGIMNWLIRIGLDATAVEGGLLKARSAGQKFSKDFKRDVSSAVAQVFSIDKIAQFGKEALAMGGMLNDMSSKLGVSAEFLQEVGFAADMAGSSIDSVSSALENLAVSRSKALEGDRNALESFAKFGVSARELKSARLEDIFQKIGKAFEGGTNPQSFIEPFRELAGKGATGLIPAMADGLSEAAEKARDLGLVLSNEVVNGLDDAGKRMDLLEKKAKVGFGTLFVEVLEPFANWIDKVAAGTQAFLGSSFEDKSGARNLEKFLFPFKQFGQAYRSAGEEQQAEAEAATAKKERNRKMASEYSGLEKGKPVSFGSLTQGGGAGGNDPLARIGGFTMFGASQDRVVKELRDHGKLLRDIKRANETVAQEVKS